MTISLQELIATIPLSFPDRYESAVESFYENAEEGIDLLRRFMIKTGEDGVGLMLLSLMYHCMQNDQKAIEMAERAHFMVSGSTFFKTLSYRLRHPEGFNAWIPPSDFADEPRPNNSKILSAPAAELDELIDVLSDVENTKIKIDQNKLISHSDAQNNASIAIDEEVDDIYTETLAGIYMKQNQFMKAKKIYLRLIDMQPEQKDKWVELAAMAEEKIRTAK